ncbi:DUF305 domain-containing protein [Streptomyces sp. NPDC006984]|uniref:DUF305 domain-containing protein n=1 Tax=Streptomyces sp. NPDC006984 TaxID=3155463 RepID=UPI0033F4D41E
MAQEVIVLTSRSTRRPALPLTAAVLVLTALTAAGCDGGTEAPAQGAGPSVVAPGRPGEPARTLSAEEAAAELPDESPNAADYRYVAMMIVHHEQALVMTDLTPGRAADDRVRRLAERIAAAQKPEIGAMQGWLEAHPGRRGGHVHEDHSTMPGMATEEQLAALRSAGGRDFDELFLRLMITHHEGAVTMAAEVLSEGNNVLVEQMANDVIAQQTAEIGRMRAL